MVSYLNVCQVVSNVTGIDEFQHGSGSFMVMRHLSPTEGCEVFGSMSGHKRLADGARPPKFFAPPQLFVPWMVSYLNQVKSSVTRLELTSFSSVSGSFGNASHLLTNVAETVDANAHSLRHLQFSSRQVTNICCGNNPRRLRRRSRVAAGPQVGHLVSYAEGAWAGGAAKVNLNGLVVLTMDGVIPE